MDLRGGGKITFDAPLRAADEARREALMADVDQLVAAIGRYRKGCEPVWIPPGTAHLTGSSRMGESEATSVTDPDGLVWGTEKSVCRLYGADSDTHGREPEPHDGCARGAHR